MLETIQKNAAVMIIKDSASHNRAFALVFSLTGLFIMYYSYPLLPDGNGFIVGILVALAGILIFFLKKSYTIVLDKNSDKLSCISTSVWGEQKTKEYFLSAIQEVNLQWGGDMNTAPSWLLFMVLRDEEDAISINANNSSLSKFFPAFRRSEAAGKKIAGFLDIPFKQKRAFED